MARWGEGARAEGREHGVIERSDAGGSGGPTGPDARQATRRRGPGGGPTDRSGARGLLAAVAVLLALPFPALAQSNGRRFEIGLDAGVQIAFPDEGDHIITVELPLSRIRVGRYLGSRFLLEASGGFVLASQAERTASAGRGELGLSYRFGRYADRARPFLLVGAGGRFQRSDGITAWQGLLIAGGGVRVTLQRRLAVRLEVDYARALETEILTGSNEIRLLTGISFSL